STHNTRTNRYFPTRRSSDLVAKYVNKKSDMDLAAKGLGAKEWNDSLKTKLSLLPKKLFRIRMSRNFGMKMLTMTNLNSFLGSSEIGRADQQECRDRPRMRCS